MRVTSLFRDAESRREKLERREPENLDKEGGAKDLVLGLHQTSEEITNESKENIQNKGEWELLRIDAYTSSWNNQGEEWSKVVFTVTIKRRPLLYLVNLVIPSAFLMGIDLFSFYLPVHQVDRGAFKMTLLLGYTVFLLIMNDLLPNNSGGTPIIGVYFSVCLALMVISLVETIFITNILHQTRSKSPQVPMLLRRVTYNIISRVICFSPSHRQAVSFKNKRNTEKSIQNEHKDPSVILEDQSGAMIHNLQKLSQDVEVIRAHLDSQSQYHSTQGEWIQIAYIWDCLLFRLYVLLLLIFTVMIIASWCMWYKA
ncbi:5-hydroxytryptamine receptor 3E-like [Lepisosteus oculatus]|uniref:5-hydroxytryptamine receptor 3E-like n=1 Tax=Lepisosteus oculatus TaxID=7918 RepID=UPI0035F52B5C